MKHVCNYVIDYDDFDDLIRGGKVFEDADKNRIFEPPVNLNPGERLRFRPIYRTREEWDSLSSTPPTKTNQGS